MTRAGIISKDHMDRQPSVVKSPTDAPLRRRANTSGQLRRSTLVQLRWAAVFGQSAALLIVSQLLGYDYPVWLCAGIVALSVLVNIVTTAAYELDRRVGDTEAAMQLGFDLLQLAALLWLTGGISNPFALLILAPVVTSATTLNKKVLFTLGILALSLIHI